MRPSDKTLRTIAREIEQFGVSAKDALKIVKAVLAWNKQFRAIAMRVATQGRRGRPRRMTDEMIEQARALRAEGLSFAAIAKVLGVRHGCTVWYQLLPPEIRAQKMKRLRENVDRYRAAREVVL